jgi:hypothetical protein
MKKYVPLIVALFLLNSFADAQIPPYVPINGLVAWFPFNGNANDESGYNHQVTANGPNTTTDRFGVADRAYEFDGVSDKISVVDNVVPNFDFIQFSISIWAFKDNQTIFFPGIISRCQPNNIGWYLYANSGLSDSIDFSGAISTGNYYNAFGAPAPIIQWVHYVCTFSPGLQKLYINGILVGTDNNPGAVFNAIGDIQIGFKTGGSYWGGKIDDIAIYDRVLSQSEITGLYNACSLGIIVQPLDQTISVGGTAQFMVSTPDTLATFQWQLDAGAGFVNLSNAGAFSGVFTNTLTVSNTTGIMNGYKFRCVLVDTSGCSVNSNFGILTVCNSSIIQQPQDQTVFVNDNAVFTVSYTAISPLYQWQENSGLGFINLTNTGLYSGTSTSNLTISNVTLAMNNYLYRCLVSDSTACSDTSNSATLIVSTGIGIDEISQTNSFIIYPNTTSNFFTIICNSNMLNANIEILNILGDKMYQAKIIDKRQTFNIEGLPSGIYCVKMNNKSEVKKLIIY